jgi:hypothetical protein
MNLPHSVIAASVCALIVTSIVGCRKRSVITPASDAAPSESGGAAGAPVVVDPPKNQPANTYAAPKPPAKPWAAKTQSEKLLQMDFWLNQHQFGDAAQQSAVASEIRGSNLIPAEKREIEEMRKRFGYRPLPL